MHGGIVAGSVLVALAGAANAQDALAGKDIYERYCVACHGAQGAGDGPMVRVLTLDPPDLRRLAARNGGTFPRARAMWRIDGRDPVLAHGNEMPVYGELFAGRDLAIRGESGQLLHSSQPMADLLAFIESLQAR